MGRYNIEITEPGEKDIHKIGFYYSKRTAGA